MSQYVGKAVVIAPALIGLYVVRRVVRKLYEDYRDRYMTILLFSLVCTIQQNSETRKTYLFAQMLYY